MMPCIIQEANGLSQCGQSAAAQAGTPLASLCTPNQMHRPACAPLCSTHRASNPVCSCCGLLGEKKKSSDNHYIGKNANKQTKKSNQHKVGKQSQLVVTLFCLASRQRVGIHCSRHYTTGSLLFRVIHINIVLPFAR